MRLFVFAPIAISIALLACEEPTSTSTELDVVGKSYLAPLRNDALAVPQLIERLKLKPDAVVADLGAGPGFLTLPIARVVRQGKVIATDIKSDYLEVLKTRAQAERLDNIVTRVVRANETGLERGSVDLALLCQVDQLVGDRVEYFRSLVPALKRGGRVVLVNYVRFRDADREAAKNAGFEVVEEWSPSVPFFVMVLTPSGVA